MIPYFQINSIIFGPLTIQVWGLFVSLGIVVAILLSLHLVKKHFLSQNFLLDLIFWTLVGAFVFARAFHVFFYEPVYYTMNPFDVLKFWQGGASSLGGFFGALSFGYLFVKKRKMTFSEILPYLDIAALCFFLGWGIGRIGCFFIHDHLGKESNFFLAVNFPSGTRHDLGFYESLLSFGIFILFAFFFKKLRKIKLGLVFLFSFLVYMLGRFLLDFLRVLPDDGGDVRYGFLTPAQWGLLFFFIFLTFWHFFSKITPKKD